MNEYIETALRTWYDKDHPLHLDLEPSLMGLAGECGELVDLYKKDKFKPGFKMTREMELDELGDIWYYLRIVVYQISDEGQVWPVKEYPWLDMKDVAIYMYIHSSNLLVTWLRLEGIPSNQAEDLHAMANLLFTYLGYLDTTIDNLTQLNWQKLSQREESNTGYGFKHD